VYLLQDAVDPMPAGPTNSNRISYINGLIIVFTLSFRHAFSRNPVKKRCFPLPLREGPGEGDV